MKTNVLAFSGFVLAAAIVYLAVIISFKPLQQAFASVTRGGEYQATSTSQFGTSMTEKVLLTGPGTLGSVIMINPSNSGQMFIYDATTSDVTKRATSMATTSIVIAAFPPATATSTYTFDANVVNGLYISILGQAPTSTITYRQSY